MISFLHHDDVIGSFLPWWRTIIQFKFGNIHQNKVLQQQQAETAKSMILGASTK